MEDKVPVHPYYPRSLSLPDYKSNQLSSYFILAVVGSILLFVYVFTWLLVRKDRYGRYLSLREKGTLSWFGLCGCIHMFLEGYLPLYGNAIASGDGFLDQTWKEYAKGDSRYVSNDTFIIMMEAITAWVDGPGCFLVVWAFFTRNSMRHVLQLCVSLCQLYGLVLYFITELYDGFTHGPLYHPIYFWVYVVGFNSPWLIMPVILIRQSWRELSRAQMALDKATGFNPPLAGSNRGIAKKKK